MPKQSRTEALKSKKEKLKQRIRTEEKRPLPDENLIYSLKAEKLAINDALIEVAS